MIAERRGDGRLHVRAHDGRPLQALEQHGGGIDEARRAIAALEAEALEERLLHRRQRDLALVVALGDPLDGADALAVKEVGARDAGRHRLAGVVVPVPDHHAGVADALAAAEMRAGQAEHLVQHVDHHEPFRHVQRTVARAVDRDRERAGRDAHPNASRT